MQIRRSWQVRLSLAIIIVLMSCLAVAASSTPASAACATPQSGQWIGTWTSNDASFSGTVGGTFTWSPTHVHIVLNFVTGTFSVSPNTSFDYAVSCNTVTGTMPSNFGGTFTHVATISADGLQVSGTYEHTPALAGGVGTWQMSAVTQSVSDTGTNLSTDTGATGATAAAPLQTAVTSPNPGVLSIEQALVPGSVVAGYSLLNQVVRITAPDATPASPLAFTFELDVSVTGGASAESIAVFRNGIRLANCTGTAGVAQPDPCVSSRVDLPNGNVQIGVLTSHASIWTLGTPPRTASVGSAAVAEGNTGKARSISFPVTLSEPSAGTVRVGYSIHDNGSATESSGDYKARTGTVTFMTSRTTGYTKTSAFITTTVTPDANPESDETFSVQLSSSDGGYELGNALGTGTILSDDTDPTPSVRVGDVSAFEGHAGTFNTAKVSIELADPATAPQSVHVAFVPDDATTGIDYKALPARTLVFKTGQWQKFIAISSIPDVYTEGNEIINVILSDPSTGLTLGRAAGRVTILNDD